MVPSWLFRFSMGRPSADLYSGLLKSVSRSFYLTLRALPAPVRRQIGLAYLLARASDTIADTDAVPKQRRLQVLETFRDRICSGKVTALDLDTLASQQSSPAERLLLERIDEPLQALTQFTWTDQQRVREVLGIIISGQALDIERFADADANHIAALQMDAELDDYTYRVAGCVGEFWTKICRAHLFPGVSLDEPQLLQEAVRFGKGLQLVNVLRDLPADLRLGRCYLPLEKLASTHLEPGDLLHPHNESQFRPAYDPYLTMAEEHLQAGWAYTNRLPYRQVRVRLACAWPILIGIKTVAKLRRGQVLDSAHRIKISRREVRSLMVRSVWQYPWRGQWQRLFEAVRSQ
jgi:farnesyl-diphosphate farnesyltransferase